MSEKENTIDNNNSENTNDNAVFQTRVNETADSKPPVILWLGLGGLVVVALLVIFVLPSIVSEYELPLERRVDVAQMNESSRPAPQLEISPFEEAQRSIQRKEAQDILAGLLETQAELTELEVEQWGQDAFNAALEQAATGDEYYRSQEFLLATQSYEAGHAALNVLLGSVVTVLTQTLISAENAFNSNDATAAQLDYSLALVLDPLNEEAQLGLDRSRTLEEVLQLLSVAEDQLEDGELEAAQRSYSQVAQLDAFNEIAPAKIGEVTQLIRERDFGQVMSRGYVLLESGKLVDAIAVFEEAGAMGISTEQALAAIVQTENEIANAEINALRDIIASAEAGEQWQVAVDNYDKVLVIDPNLTFAIEGRDYAGKRQQLDSLLVSGIENPERLAEDDVYQQNLDVYFTGRGIENPGRILVSQLDTLQGFLEDSQVPIDIQLISDNLTDVTLLRIGHIGLFERHQVALKPGRYVAVGKRAGFREVREEFVVGFDQTPSLVVVRCDERVVAAGR